MNTQVDTISVEAKKLSIPERIILAEELWDSIANEQSTLKMTATQRKELDSRIDEYQSNPDEGSSWHEVKNRIKKNK
jgi:putative addiction module component (TIGR02574 family)